MMEQLQPFQLKGREELFLIREIEIDRTNA